MISPHAGGPFVEQATAAPGELRQLESCGKELRHVDTVVFSERLRPARCDLPAGHEGDCSYDGRTVQEWLTDAE